MKLSFFLAIALIYSCTQKAENNNILYTASSPSIPAEVVAKIANESILNKELEKGIEVEIFELEEKIFNLKMDRLKVIMLERFMNLEPKKAGLSNDEFFEKYISKDFKPTKSEINEFIKSRGITADQLGPDLLPRVETYLRENQKKKALDRWLNEEAEKYKVEVFFKKPLRPVFNVNIGDSPSMGNKNAKVTIVAYSDYQCPFSKKGSEILKELWDTYGDKVNIVHKDFPLPFHSRSKILAQGALCANDQSNKYFWKFYFKLFEDQTIGSKDQLKDISKSVGLDLDKFTKCLESNKYGEKIEEEINEAIKLGIKSTPTFFINGKIINGAHQIEVFKNLIDEELKLNKKNI